MKHVTPFCIVMPTLTVPTGNVAQQNASLGLLISSSCNPQLPTTLKLSHWLVSVYALFCVSNCVIYICMLCVAFHQCNQRWKHLKAHKGLGKVDFVCNSTQYKPLTELRRESMFKESDASAFFGTSSWRGSALGNTSSTLGHDNPAEGNQQNQPKGKVPRLKRFSN